MERNSVQTTHRVVNNPYDQTAAWASRYVLVIRKLLLGDLETISTGTRVVVNAPLLVPGHILDLDFIIICTHLATGRPSTRCRRVEMLEVQEDDGRRSEGASTVASHAKLKFKRIRKETPSRSLKNPFSKTLYRERSRFHKNAKD